MKKSTEIATCSLIATLFLAASTVTAFADSPVKPPESPVDFADCGGCPRMIAVPPGSFVMGSPAEELGRSLTEEQRRITFARRVAVGRFAVTFDEWDKCVREGGCNGYRPSDEGWGRGNRPVVNVNWNDAQAYVDWLSRKTGYQYRLPSEAEREYIARAGSVSPFWWGNTIDVSRANIDAPVRSTSSAADAAPRRRTVEVDAFAPNAWGFFNVHGNVWEWTANCWNEDNLAQPQDGRALLDGDCGRRAARGGSWNDFDAEARSAARFGFDAASRNALQGFRVARDLP